MKFGMCSEFCEGWEFEKVCTLAADAGYDGVEIAPFTLADSVHDISYAERTALEETAATHGLEVVGLHWLLVRPEGLHLNSLSADIRRRTVDYLHAEIDFCADIGGRVMVLGSPKQRNVLPGQSYQDVWERMVKTARDLSEHAQRRDVCVCIEPLGPEETNFIHTADQARRLVREVNHPAFRMLLDVKAMATYEEPMPRIIRDSADLLAHFHANDANRCGPGFGETDFELIAATLYEIGYDGYVSVEVFDFSPGPERIAHKSIEYLRDVFSRAH